MIFSEKFGPLLLVASNRHFDLRRKSSSDDFRKQALVISLVFMDPKGVFLMGFFPQFFNI